MSYETIATIIGPLVAVFTVYLEYKKDMNIKLQDRKQLWLKEHYIYIQGVIKGAISNMLVKNTMIYNGAVQISIDSASKQGMYQMTIINHLSSLANGNIKEHLKSYEFYNDFMDLYKKVETYKTELRNLYFEFLKISQTTVGDYFNGSVRSRADSSSSVEIYDLEQMFYALVYSVFTKSDYRIGGDPNKNFTLEYNNGGSYYSIFISKSRTNADTFLNFVIPYIRLHFNDKLMSLGAESTKIGNDLDNLIPKLSKIVGDYNAGFPIKGECEDCKSIKSVKKLDGLMPPN